MNRYIIIISAVCLTVLLNGQSTVKTNFRLELGWATIHDEKIKDQFRGQPFYMLALGFEKSNSVVNVFTSARFSKRGAFNKVLDTNLSLFYLGVDGGISLEHHISKVDIGVYVDYLLNRESSQRYKFNNFDTGFLTRFSLHRIMVKKIEVLFFLSGSYSIFSIYDNSRFGPYIPLTDRSSNWSSNITIGLPIQISF